MADYCNHPDCEGNGFMQSGVDPYYCTGCYGRPDPNDIPSVGKLLPSIFVLSQNYDYYGEAWDFVVNDIANNIKMAELTAFDQHNAIIAKKQMVTMFGQMDEVKHIAHPEVDYVNFV